MTKEVAAATIPKEPSEQYGVRRPGDFLGIAAASKEYKDLRRALYQLQDGTCPLCNRTLGELVFDHDHHTGHARNALCRPCNGLLGRVEKHEGDSRAPHGGEWALASVSAPYTLRAHITDMFEWQRRAWRYLRRWHNVVDRVGPVYRECIGAGKKPKPASHVSHSVFEAVGDCLVQASAAMRVGKSAEEIGAVQAKRPRNWPERWLTALHAGGGRGTGWTWKRFTQLTAIMTITTDWLAEIRWDVSPEGERCLVVDMGWMHEDGISRCIYGYSGPKEEE